VERKEVKTVKKKFRRILSGLLALTMLLGVIPTEGNGTVAKAATTASVSLSSLGSKGSISIGSKTKSGTWWKMQLNGKTAFCMNLGYTCHTGNTYGVEEKYTWNQNTGGDKKGYYAKIIRWYVLDGKRTKKSFLMSQALIWSVQEGCNSESQLKDVIKQVKNKMNIYPAKTAAELYKAIFEPDGNWEVTATYWQKTGNSNKYQRLLTVDAEETPSSFNPKTLSDTTAYRQRITVKKTDEDGNGLGNIQFTLDADNLDDLYSFSVTDRNGVEASSADDDNETSFSMTGHTRDTGRLAFRMTYHLQTMDYYYFSDADLAAMSSDDKKAAKKYLTDDLELDEGVDFPSDLKKSSAEKMAKQELNDLMDNISNTYTLTEDNTGENNNIIVDPTYANGVEITLGKENSWQKDEDGSWPESKEEVPSDYTKAYITGVTNKYKKASIHVVKADQYSEDKKAHGDADLDGAQFQLYMDIDCTTKATVYDASGAEKTAEIYTIQNGNVTTDYLRSGVTYYLKEVKAPVGYNLSTDVLPVTADASNQTVEYTSDISTVEYGNAPILGKVAIQKYYSDEDTGEVEPETNTTFQVYLKAKKSFDACDDYERAVIKTDENGYASTGNLYYGTYVVHQVDSGDVDAIPVDDFEVEVTEDGKVYTYSLNNKLFKAYLRILKKDKQTEKQVLKAGTAYKIYKVTDDGEELVTQTYSSGNQEKTIDIFVTDESGEIMTVKPLRSAKYRIYEVDSASGLHITEEFIEVVINSKSDNYESYKDEEGNTHAVITMTYTNEETYGKLAVSKTGQMLTGWDKDTRKFIYEERSLKGAEFEIYADGDIVTQDNQGDTWFQDGEKVATIITGEKAEFTSDCKGICTQSVDEKGVVHLTLPLGKYKVKEVKTRYGYVFPKDTEWNLAFTWDNGKDEFVLNSTEDTDKEGQMNLTNELARPEISLLKEDADTKEPVSGAAFGLYSKHDIYNVDGEKIVEAGTQLTVLTTGKDGSVTCDMMLPLKDEGYVTTGSAVSGSAVHVETSTTETGGNEALNSGEYYLKELSVSGSYYLDETPIPVQLCYYDATTPVIYAQYTVQNKQTTNEIDKLSVADSKELSGCGLVITDASGKKIISWTSGDKDSVKVFVSEADGYVNLKYSFDKTGNLHVGGLLHDTEYTLTETRPADGYVTAESIVYMIKQKTQEDGSVASVVSVKQEDGSFAEKEDDKTVMTDEQTKIRLIKLDKKTGQGLAGAKFVVTDEKGNKVTKVTSTEDGVDIIGKLVVGKTYTFTEVSAPKGFQTAKAVEYTVKDTAEVQRISVTDTRISTTPHVPQTGKTLPILPMSAALLAALGVGLFLSRKKKIVTEK
jgi:hypothetical protein